MNILEQIQSSLKTETEAIEDRIIASQILNDNSMYDDAEMIKLENELRQLMQSTRDNFNKKFDSAERSLFDAQKRASRDNYVEFMKNVKEALHPLQKLITAVFDKLADVITNICRWIKEKAENVIERIREAFTKLRKESFEK